MLPDLNKMMVMKYRCQYPDILLTSHIDIASPIL